MEKEHEVKFIATDNYYREITRDKKRDKIYQNYLYVSDDLEIRVRDYSHWYKDDTYFLTVKKGKGESREEFEIQLTEDQYLRIQDEIDALPIIKKRGTVFKSSGLEIVADEFLQPEHPPVVEVEFASKESLERFSSEFSSPFLERTSKKNKDIWSLLNSKRVPKPEKTIFCVLGPSGSGKSTLVDYVKEELGVVELISHTTRDMREGETQGYPYHFITEGEFLQLEFIEKVLYGGNHYGLSKEEVELKVADNDKVLVIVDKHGIEQIKDLYPDLVKVIYVYSTPEECAERMRESRGVESAFGRVLNSLKDREHDNNDISDHIVRNKDLESAKRQFKFIIENE